MLKIFFLLLNIRSEEGTVGRAIFDDNIELFQQLLTVHPDEEKDQILDILDLGL